MRLGFLVFSSLLILFPITSSAKTFSVKVIPIKVDEKFNVAVVEVLNGQCKGIRAFNIKQKNLTKILKTLIGKTIYIQLNTPFCIDNTKIVGVKPTQ